MTISDSLPSGPYCTEQIGWLDEHLNHMLRCELAEGTIKARRMVLTWLAEFLGHDPATATANELDWWQANLPTINAVRWQTHMIRPYYRYLQARGVRTDNPAALLPCPKARKRLPKPIPDDRLFVAIAEAPPSVLPWLLLAGWSGLRAMEIAKLEVENFSVDEDGGAWIRVIGKGDSERDVPVPDWVWKVIQPLLPESGRCWTRRYRKQDGPVKPKHVSENCNYYLRVQCGLPDRLHRLRARVATAVLRDSHDVRMVQELLGHSNLATLHVYTLVRRDDMMRAVNRLPRAPRFDAGPPAVAA